MRSVQDAPVLVDIDMEESKGVNTVRMAAEFLSPALTDDLGRHLPPETCCRCVLLEEGDGPASPT